MDTDWASTMAMTSSVFCPSTGTTTRSNASAISMAEPGLTSTRKSSCRGGCGSRGSSLKTAARSPRRVASGTLTKTSAPKSYA